MVEGNFPPRIFNTAWIDDPGLRHYMANQLMKLAYNIGVEIKNARLEKNWALADTYRTVLAHSNFEAKYQKDGSIVITNEPYQITILIDDQLSLHGDERYPDEPEWNFTKRLD